MRIFTHLQEINPKNFDNAVVTVGVFDGMHLGHQAILRDLLRLAEIKKGEGVVVTFDRHPAETLTGKAPPWILSLAHRMLILQRASAQNVVIMAFDEKMANLTAEGFIREILKEQFGAVGLVMGPGNNFGKGGEGTAKTARKLGKKHGIQVIETQPIIVDGKTVSSTAIREAILRGDLDEANSMMGRPVTLLGEVVEGEGRGRKIGFPTANLDLRGEILPPNGVYAGTTTYQRRVFRSMMNIGVRPTFSGDKRVVEVHLLDFQGDLYGLSIEVTLLAHLREEKKFDRVEDLVQQLERDRNRTRNAISNPS
ncbi:MAG: bifunctional riboflavin kinase/FAD synthetase [Planctomycetota bacterium]|nr:bifunctional riboflavin kinase/FAD synthetase [Planctomycetota bacterium]